MDAIEQHRCDRCCARAIATMLTPNGGTLNFCGHHARTCVPDDMDLTGYLIHYEGRVSA